MEKEISTEIGQNEGGKIIFANDVIATIASLAAVEVEGVVSLAGGVMEELSGKLGKKSYTKGVKVDVKDEGTAVDLTVVVKYGSRIQDVCAAIQQNVQKSIETMTGLHVTTVNVFVQSIAFDKPAKPEVTAGAESAQSTEEEA